MRFRRSSVSPLAGGTVEDYGALTFAAAPAYIAELPLVDGGSEYTLVFGSSLGRRGLMDLLYSVAPYKAHGPDSFARVLDNWRLHDRAETSAASENLLLQHARSLKANWEIFSAHRLQFIEVLEDRTESVRLLPFLSWRKDRDGRRAWQFPSLASGLQEITAANPDLARLADEGKSTFDAVAGLVTLPYLIPSLRRRWKQWQPLVKGGKSNYVGPASSPMICLQHQRALLNCRLIARAEALLRDELVGGS